MGANFKGDIDSVYVMCCKGSKILVILTLVRMGFFGAAHGWGRGQKGPPVPKICHTYPTMMKLDTVIP